MTMPLRFYYGRELKKSCGEKGGDEISRKGPRKRGNACGSEGMVLKLPGNTAHQSLDDLQMRVLAVLALEKV